MSESAQRGLSSSRLFPLWREVRVAAANKRRRAKGQPPLSVEAVNATLPPGTDDRDLDMAVSWGALLLAVIVAFSPVPFS